MEELGRLVVFLVVLCGKAIVLLLKLALRVGFGLSFEKDEPAELAPSEHCGHDPQDTETLSTLLQRFDALAQEARAMRESIEWDRANQGLRDVLDTHLIPGCKYWAEKLRQEEGPLYDLAADSAAKEFEIVIEEVRVLVQQRKSNHLRQDIGDADAMARACYAPLVAFAQANRVALTTTVPMVQLSNFELSTWTAFIPTGVAPIFLPSEFFQRLAWWPALAHEIGHDFLAATHDVDWQIRQQLELCSAQEGRQLLRIDRGGLSYWEVKRLFAGWLEEMFCDVLATMMLGPAYGWTMIELFSGSSVEVQSAACEDKLFAPHPPQHLRLLNCAHLLDFMGHTDDANELRNAWGHQDITSFFLASTSLDNIEIPIEFLTEMSFELVRNLYSTPLDALAGHSLESLPGVDYGPHAAAETRRTQAAFLAKQLPETSNPFRIIAGAVMAWHQAPHREAEFMAMCRVAIVGEAEWAEPDLAPSMPTQKTSSCHTHAREAFLLSTILGVPPGLRNSRSTQARSIGQRVGR